MSSPPHSFSTMEPMLKSSVCLICFEITEKRIYVPSDATEKLFINCNKYLHSTLTKGTLHDIEIRNENQMPLCKKCFDSAWELTQLSEQLASIQKDISDLTVAFSMAVFHRRSQVYSIGQSCKTSSIVEFNEACLPPNLFSMKLIVRDQNIHPNKNDQEMGINDLHLQTDISNVRCENSDTQFDNLTGNPHQSVVNEDIEIQLNKENLDEQCGQSTVEQNQNLASVSEMKIVHVTSRNDSKQCADPKNGLNLAMSDLLKSVKMPKIILERIEIVGHKVDVLVDNSNQTKCETLFKDDEFSVHSCATNSPEDEKLLKCLYCDKIFIQEWHRTLHHKTHTGDKLYKSAQQKFGYRSNQKICKVGKKIGKKSFYKCSYCEKGFSYPSALQIHERTHTGEKPFKCSYCNSRFVDRSSLKVHERTHTGEKPFKCSYCTTRFRTSSALKDHKRTHTGEKPFKCSFCNKPFINSSKLKCHERTHTGEKPFKCSFCNKPFIDSSILKRHERTHTGEKPFKCSFCNYRFNTSSSLRRHEKTHSEEKSFARSHQKDHQDQVSSLISQVGTQKEGCLGHLKHEEQMHSTCSMEFKCTFCEMTFNHNEARANHEKIHITEDEILNENFIVGI